MFVLMIFVYSTGVSMIFIWLLCSEGLAIALTILLLIAFIIFAFMVIRFVNKRYEKIFDRYEQNSMNAAKKKYANRFVNMSSNQL